MDYFGLSVQILKGIEHLEQEKTSCVLTEALAPRIFDQVKHVEVVSAKVLCDQVDVSVVSVEHSLDVHDSIVAMTDEL